MIRWALRAASLSTLLVTSSAPAATLIDRTLTITLGDRITLAYVVQISGAELARIRREADADHDGKLSRAEADKVVASFTSALEEDVRYASGQGLLGPYGRLAAGFPMSKEVTGLEGPIEVDAAAEGARLSWKYDLRIARGDDRLAIDDGAHFVAFDGGKVVVRDTPSRKFVSLGDDPARMHPVPELTTVGAKQAFHVTWAPGPESARGMLMMLVVVVGVAIAGATLWSVSGAARRKQPPPPPQ